jgi:hypothetical protein
MEHNKIETLLEKYLDGSTTIAEEKELTNYFSQPNVALHLQQYQSIFGYYKQAKSEQFVQEIPLKTIKQKVAWLSIAASVTILVGLSAFLYSNFQSKNNQDLGTFNNPETAYFETQKQLNLISEHINTGIESVNYITEYETSKNLIFKK